MESKILFYVKRYFDSYVKEDGEYRKFLKRYFLGSEDENDMIVSIYHPYPFYSVNEYDIKIGYLLEDVDISFEKKVFSFYNLDEYDIKNLGDLLDCHIHPSLYRMYYITVVLNLPFLEKSYIEELDGIQVLEKLYEYIGKVNDSLSMDVIKNIVVIREKYMDRIGIYIPCFQNFHKLISYLSFPYYAEPFKPVQRFNIVVQSWAEDGAGEYDLKITLDNDDIVYFDRIDVPFGEVAIYTFIVNFDRRGMHRLLFEFLKNGKVCLAVDRNIYIPYLSVEEESEEIRKVIEMIKEVEDHSDLELSSK